MVLANQIPLRIVTDDEATLDNFQPRIGALEALSAVQSLCGDPQGEVFIAGGPGTGKSHLLQALSHSLGGSALYLPLIDVAALPPEAVLEGHDRYAVLMVDDLQVCLGLSAWQDALFHVFNQRRGLGLAMLWSADTVPTALEGLLPDLQSRLAHMTVYQLMRQSEQELADMLSFRAAKRGLQLSNDVLKYVLARAPRSPLELMQLLERLDQASLAHSRPITVPLIAELKLLSPDL